MEVLSAVYYELLKTFPFSITGYDDIESKISDFFSTFCNHPLNKENKNISFIVGLFGKLAGLDNFNSNIIEKINDWETDRIKKFLFCNYEGDRAELVMSFYIYQLQSLMDMPGRYAINILTDNFRNDIDLLISLSTDENPNFFYYEDEKVFEIKVPKSIYRDDIFENPSETKDKLREKLQRQLIKSDQDNLHVKFGSQDTYELEIYESNQESSKTDKELYENKLGREIFSKTFSQFYDSNKNYLLSEFNSSLLKNAIFKNDNIQIEELMKIAYAGSFLCAYYGVNLNYILSTCRVVDNKTFGLGGLAVGTKSDSPFDKSHRAFYKIFANQIASNLSGQITYNLFSSEIYKEKASILLSNLCSTESSLHSLTHSSEFPNRDKVPKWKNDTINSLDALKGKKVISKRTFERAKLIIEGLKPDVTITDDEKTELDGLFRLKIKDLKTSYLTKHFKEIEISLSDLINDSIQYNFDFGWLIEVLSQIPYMNFKSHVNATIPNPKLKIEMAAVDNDGNECSNENNVNHYLRIRMIDNGCGMELPQNIKNSKGSYRLLHKGNHFHEVLKTHGNIIIHSKGKKVSILEIDQEDSLKSSEILEGTVFEILLRAN